MSYRQSGIFLRRDRRRLGGGYASKVLGSGPIAYWPLDEGSGAVAQCLVNPLQNGTAVGVTWANDSSGPFGTPAPFFDGANDYVNIYTAALDAAFNGATGSMMIWLRVNAAAVWTDAAVREAIRILDDGNNYYYMRKMNVANQLGYRGNAGGGISEVTQAYSATTWFAQASTWSDGANADEYKAYLNGAQVGPTSALLNVWGGDGLANTEVTIGASSSLGPGTPWHGWLAHGAVWDRVLTPAEILALANP